MPALPAGVELFRLRDGDEIELVTASGVRRLDEDGGLLRFIDDGQRAHYLIGGADSGPERPSHATVKFGIVAPHSARPPHPAQGRAAHRGPRDRGTGAPVRRGRSWRAGSRGGGASTPGTAPSSGWC